MKVVNKGLLRSFLEPDNPTMGQSPPRPKSADPGLFLETDLSAQTSASPRQPSERAEHARRMKEMEEQRQRRYDRSRSDAAAKAAEADRKVREGLVLKSLRMEDRFQANFSSIMEGRALAASIKEKQDLQDESDRNKMVPLSLATMLDNPSLSRL